MALVGYARVSTRDQHPEAQTDALATAGCEKTFTDHASGTLAKRPALDEALSYLRSGGTLVVTKLDRLGRSVRNLKQVADDLRARQVGLRAVGQGIDTTTPGGRLFFRMLAAIAEFEHDLIVERTHDGLAAARARGRKGRPKFKMTPNKIARARAMYDGGGHTVQEIADPLGAGHVVDTGPGLVTSLRTGDAVVAMSAMGATGRGTRADYVCLPTDIVTAAPRNVGLTDAAGLPLAGLAALDAVDTLDPALGSTVLVAGATGAVGGLAIQLLRLRDHTVHAVVRDQPARVAAARALGADHVVTGAPQPGRYDCVLDTAGTPCPGALRGGGRYVSIVPGTLPDLAEADGTAVMSYVQENGARLAHLVDLVDNGRLTLRTAATYPLDAAAEAMRAFDRSSTGKIIIDLLQGRAG